MRLEPQRSLVLGQWRIKKELERGGGDLPHFDMLIFYFDHRNNGSICEGSRRVARGDMDKCPLSEIFCKLYFHDYKFISS